MDKKTKVLRIISIFDKLYPGAACSLIFENPLQLLISTILAAQCTDARVNLVAEKLYNKYKTAEDFAESNLKELEDNIRSTGFYHNKARNIKLTCKILMDEFNSVVPDNIEDLLKLPGVGRKTANLILGDIYGVPSVVVDTHAKRLSNRIGFTNSGDPKRIEFDLMKIVPKEKWTSFCHQLVFHGRAVCAARVPKCNICEISLYCNYMDNK